MCWAWVLGVGIGQLFEPSIFANRVTWQDLSIIVALLLIGLLVSSWVHFLERQNPLQATVGDAEAPAENAATDSADFIVLPDPVTHENLLSPYRG